MPCSAQKVDTAPRGASSGHCEIARRTRGSIGSWAATAAASRPKCHHQDHQNGHPCPDTELSPMSCEMTLGWLGDLQENRTNVRSRGITWVGVTRGQHWNRSVAVAREQEAAT